MKPFIVCFLLCLSLVAGTVHAGEIREIELIDGSIITGEVLSLAGGIYTIKSESLGTIKLEDSKIRAIRTKSSLGGPALSNENSGTEVKSLQDKMMNDKEIMGMIQSLQNDPEFKKILEDPEMMKAVNSGDVAALMANPRFMKLLNNQTVQEIEKKVK
jgi:hypothetical protein